MKKIFLLLICLYLTRMMILTTVGSGATCLCPNSNCQVIKVGNLKSSSWILNIKIDINTKVIIQQTENSNKGWTSEFIPENFKEKNLLSFVAKTASGVPISLRSLSTPTTAKQPTPAPAQTGPKPGDLPPFPEPDISKNTVQCFTFKILNSGKSQVPFFYYLPWDRAVGSMTIVEIEINNSVIPSISEKALTTEQMKDLKDLQDTYYTTKHMSTAVPDRYLPSKNAQLLKGISCLIFILTFILIF